MKKSEIRENAVWNAMEAKMTESFIEYLATCRFSSVMFWVRSLPELQFGISRY